MTASPRPRGRPRRELTSDERALIDGDRPSAEVAAKIGVSAARVRQLRGNRPAAASRARASLEVYRETHGEVLRRARAAGVSVAELMARVIGS